MRKSSNLQIHRNNVIWRPGTFIVNFEYIFHLVSVLLLLILNM